MLVLYAFWFSYKWNVTTVLVITMSRGVALISMWIPKGMLLITGQCLYEVWHLLEPNLVYIAAIIYFLKINKRYTRTRCEMGFKLAIETPD